MASEFLLDPEEFILPISDAEPGGRKLNMMELLKLKEYQEDFDPERDLTPEERQDPQFADSQRKTPQWNAIIDFGSKFLKSDGKDLEMVMRMIEAMTKTRNGGFAGVTTGFRLARRLCEECWDYLHPQLDPDDPESLEDRAGKFNWLDDPEKKPYFPTTIRNIPLLDTPDKRQISYLSCQQQGSREAEISQDEFRQAVNQCSEPDFERVKNADEDIAAAMDEIRQLTAVLDAKAGSVAPGLTWIRKALTDCKTMSEQIIRMRGSGGDDGGASTPDGDAHQAGDASATGTSGVAGVGTAITFADPSKSREEIYRQLAKLADLLAKSDPHSPAPMLIHKVIELKDKKFHELVDELTKDARVLDFMRPPVDESGEGPFG